MSFASDASARLTAAKDLDAALADVGAKFAAYTQAVNATVASASELTGVNVRDVKERLADSKVEAQVVGTIAAMLPHNAYITQPGGLRPQAEADAWIASLTTGAAG
jgi:hypothetical protein